VTGSVRPRQDAVRHALEDVRTPGLWAPPEAVPAFAHTFTETCISIGDSPPRHRGLEARASSPDTAAQLWPNLTAFPWLSM
jgi:hypothetical protein